MTWRLAHGTQKRQSQEENPGPPLPTRSSLLLLGSLLSFSVSHPCISLSLLLPPSPLTKLNGPLHLDLRGAARLGPVGALEEAVCRKPGWVLHEWPSGGRAHRWLPSTGS